MHGGHGLRGNAIEMAIDERVKEKSRCDPNIDPSVRPAWLGMARRKTNADCDERWRKVGRETRDLLSEKISVMVWRWQNLGDGKAKFGESDIKRSKNDDSEKIVETLISS